MSRIRTTLDSVTKAVSSTDLISKFSRLKPTGNHAAKAQKETLASGNPAAASTTEIAMKEEGEEKDSDGQCHQVGDGSLPSSSSGVAKPTMQLFHSAALSTNMDETYRTLAQHVNSYFGTSAQGDEECNAPMLPRRRRDVPFCEPVDQTVSQTSAECIPVLSPATENQSIQASTSALPPPPSENSSCPLSETSQVHASEVAARPTPEPATSTKKRFTHYLSYPRPSVQAFVGSYIAPLVPKFRGEAKSVASDRDKASEEDAALEKTAEKQESEEEKAKRKLLLQREKVCDFKKVLSEFHKPACPDLFY